MDRHAGAPDLEMQVRLEAEHGKIRLSFVLHSPAGTVPFSHLGVRGPLLQRSPEDYQAYLLGKIEKLGARLDIDGSPLLREEIAGKLESLGHDLWNELFPAELHTAYREHIRPRVRSWVIISDEPWIPWEIVKPYDGSRPDDLLDDDFLCLRFELTRWLAGVMPSVQKIRAGRLSVVQSAPGLPHADQERALFDQLKRSFPRISIALPRLNSAHDAQDFLTETEADLIHFIGHGVPLKDHPEDAGLPFADKSFLRPTDLHGTLATHLGQRRPLVFLNTCWAGKEGWSLTRLGGWASRWVGTCGCGAFIAPLWPVRDQVALSFAWTFYDALAHGATLGKAALAARRKVQEERQGDPSVLAYTVYGQPDARVHFDAAEDEPRGKAGKIDPGQWAPKRYRRVPRWLWSLGAILAGLASALHFAAPSLLETWLPAELLGPQHSLPKHQPPPAPPPPVTTTIGGLSFSISGGRSSLRPSFQSAFRKAAQPLVDAGISGWAISVRLESPRITHHDTDGFSQVSCRLAAAASAQGGSARADLGRVEQVNSQFNETDACEAAVTPLAEDVVNQFAAFLQKKGES